MDPATNSQLILSLIVSDMRNQKLIAGLNQAGVLVEDFYTDLGTTILKLMGFEDLERDDDLYDFYDRTMDRLIDLDIDEFLEKQKSLGLELYKALLAERISRK